MYSRCNYESLPSFLDIWWLILHFPPWSHANNTRQWGITRHTVPTWLLVISVRGTHINDMNTSPVWKQQKVLLNSQQNTVKWEPGLLRATQHRGDVVNSSCTPLSSTLESKRLSIVTPKSTWSKLVGLKCLRLRTRSSSTVWRSSTADWTDFYIHHITHPYFHQAREQDKGKCITASDIYGTSTPIIHCFKSKQQSPVMTLKVQSITHACDEGEKHRWQ